MFYLMGNHENYTTIDVSQNLDVHVLNEQFSVCSGVLFCLVCWGVLELHPNGISILVFLHPNIIGILVFRSRSILS